MIEEYREDTLLVADAQISFQQEKYEEVIELLRGYSPYKKAHMIRVRWLLVCSHFAVNRDDVDFIKYTIRNFETYIRNNKEKISGSNFKGSLNMARILKRLISDPRYDWLNDDLISSKNIVFRSWLRDYSLNYLR